MQENIQQLFTQIRSTLPLVLGKDVLALSATNLPNIKTAELHTNRIAITKRWHTYNDCYRIEQMHLSATPEYFQILGLAMFCAVFQQQKITINLTNEKSFIRKIVIGHDAHTTVGLMEKPTQYQHYANEIMGRNPYHWQEQSVFPAINLVSESGNCHTEADWEARNVLVFGRSNAQIAHLAEIFLNFGNPNNQQPELVLEGHAGNCCLQPTSVEMVCWLPDSLGYFEV